MISNKTFTFSLLFWKRLGGKDTVLCAPIIEFFYYAKKESDLLSSFYIRIVLNICEKTTSVSSVYLQ